MGHSSTHHGNYHSSNNRSGKSLDLSKGSAVGIGALALVGAGRILRGVFHKGKELAVDMKAGANLRKQADTAPTKEEGSTTDEKKDSSPKK